LAEWIPLPELPLPAGVEACALCELSRQRSRVIWGEGNPEGPVFVLLDNPGAREDAAGSPFVCGTRQTLREAARAAGVSDQDLHVSWVLKCRPRRAYDKEGCRAACRPYLEQQLTAPGVRVVFCLGNVALQALLGDPEAEVKQLRGRMLEHGGRPLVVSYHPLAARRRPNLFGLLVADFGLVGQIL
jgi:uracil-DNA glycosylase